MALETPVVDLEYRRGDSRAIVFVLTDSSSGAALDLTGYTSPVLAVNSEPTPGDDTNELFKVTGTIVDAAAGKVSFAPTTTDSDQTPSTYFYDAQIIDAAGGKLTFVRGKFAIKQDIAKD
jgi:hypothetical protein